MNLYRCVIGTLILEAVAIGTITAVSAGETVTVTQNHRQFMPDTLEVKRGTVVHIVNDDSVTHHVYVDAPNMSFDSGEEPVGQAVDLSFDRVGTFPVQCAIHPTMHLDVTVK